MQSDLSKRPLKGILVLAMLAACCYAQSIISGDVTGVITDTTGAVVPNVKITLKNVNTGTTQTTTSNAAGAYRFALVPPGTYAVTAELPGFQTVQRAGVVVTAGQPTAADMQLTVSGATQTVEVTEAATGVQTENANVSTVYNTEQILNMPNPGGDLTYIAQTAPGVVMNTQGPYGNFSAFGLPATSNLFMVNGQNFNDPYLNLNNSGASNLTLGFNEIGEANIVNNAYSAQYGQYAGSQVNYVTKSGTNDFHGDAIYFWNGRTMNANDFFSNSAGQARPFVNFNQWATGLGGPVWKNHTFFNVNYEGYRVVLPSASNLVRIPSQQFQAATLANLNQVSPASVPFYQQMFKIYNGAPAAASATPVTTNNGGCGTLNALAAGVPCALQFRTTAPNSGREYQWAVRVDHTFSDKDRAYIRLFRDNGFQPTYTDPLTPAFNAYSNQPQMSGQIAETHTLGSTSVNEFKFSALHYSAVFLPSDQAAALSALPTVVAITGAPLSELGGIDTARNFIGNFPQGRRVTQYQIIDDFSKIIGRHTVRLGFSWLHDDLTELGYNVLTHGLVRVGSLQEFYNGGGPRSNLNIRYPSATEQPFLFRTIGGYVSDDWRVNDRLNVSLNLRLESYGNPQCGHNCISTLASEFTGAPIPASTPYDQLIRANQSNAFPDTPAVVWEPRIGIAWRPTARDTTVIRTGAGIFADELPGTLARAMSRNVPGYLNLTVSNGAIAPGVPNSLFTTANQTAQFIQGGFASGGNLQSIQQVFPAFSPPNFTMLPMKFKNPTYYKWNFEVQQALGTKMVLSINYVGTHGIHIPVLDGGLNAYCPPSACPNGFAGLPSAPPAPSFNAISQYLLAGTSNYNGLTVNLTRRLSAGFMFNLNYTWSHALDVVSNGGINPFDLSTDISLLSPQDPHNIKRYNYGNADQDVRHYISLNWTYQDIFRRSGFRWGPGRIFGGWVLSGNLFYRTGLPFTVIDSNATNTLIPFGYGGAPYASVFATPMTNQFPSCDKSAVDTPCLNTSEFVPAQTNPTGFGQQTRNSFRGPGFFNMDVGLMKDVAITERIHFQFGAQAFNLLNHPNFDKPVNDIADPNFGLITTLVGPPTSILGSGLGAGASPRFVEVRAQVRF